MSTNRKTATGTSLQVVPQAASRKANPRYDKFELPDVTHSVIKQAATSLVGHIYNLAVNPAELEKMPLVEKLRLAEFLMDRAFGRAPTTGKVPVGGNEDDDKPSAEQLKMKDALARLHGKVKLPEMVNATRVTDE